MPLNWYIESMKWRFLIGKIARVKPLQSFKAVISGVAFAIFTPNRIGELAGRIFVLERKDRAKGFFITGVGSLSQMAVTLLCGLIAGVLILIYYPEKILEIGQEALPFIKVISVLAVLLFMFLFFNLKKVYHFIQGFRFSERFKETLQVISIYTAKELTIAIVFSFTRYVIFLLQFYLLMLFFHSGILFHEAAISIALTYFVSSVIPSFALAEIGVRGSAALFFAGMFVDSGIAILSATVLLWIINLAIPAIIGAGLFIRTKI